MATAFKWIYTIIVLGLVILLVLYLINNKGLVGEKQPTLPTPFPTQTLTLTPSPTGIQPSEGICKDLCGDGVCQEIVCLAEGCPCPETPQSCPQDCQR